MIGKCDAHKDGSFAFVRNGIDPTREDRFFPQAMQGGLCKTPARKNELSFSPQALARALHQFLLCYASWSVARVML